MEQGEGTELEIQRGHVERAGPGGALGELGEGEGEGGFGGGEVAFELGVVGGFEEFSEEGAGFEAGGGEVVAGEEGWGGVVEGGEVG